MDNYKIDFDFMKIKGGKFDENYVLLLCVCIGCFIWGFCLLLYCLCVERRGVEKVVVDVFDKLDGDFKGK